MGWIDLRKPDPFWDRPEDEIWRDLAEPSQPCTKPAPPATGRRPSCGTAD
jgi:hypothetical protein